MRPAPVRSAIPAAALMAALGLGLAGCAADVGDLGRARPSVWNDAIMPAIGSYAAWGRGEKVSSFHFTDDEEELRTRAWRFIMPAHERTWFHKNVQELARTRIIPVDWQTLSPDRYGAALLSESFRSEHSRYTRLAEDAVADMALIAPFRKIAQRVAVADKIRMRTASLSPAITPPTPENAAARVAENEGIVAWVRERLRYRIANYRHALDNLVVELPSREAVMAERAIVALEAEARLLDAMAGHDYRAGATVILKD